MRSPRVTTTPLLIAGLATGCTVPASITTTCSGARFSASAAGTSGFASGFVGAGAVGSWATAMSAASTGRQVDTKSKGKRRRMLVPACRREGSKRGRNFYGTTHYRRQRFLGVVTYRLRTPPAADGGGRDGGKAAHPSTPSRGID